MVALLVVVGGGDKQVRVKHERWGAARYGMCVWFPHWGVEPAVVPVEIG